MRLFKDGKVYLNRLLEHAVDDSGSTRVEVIKSLSALKKLIIPTALLKELVAARQK